MMRPSDLTNAARVFGFGVALFLAVPTAALSRTSVTAAQTSRTQALVEANVQQALDEQRYVDAELGLQQAASSALRSPKLQLLQAELMLARGDYNAAMARFEAIAPTPGVEARALQGMGVSLALQGKSVAALAALKMAVAKDPSLWRAWNALGEQYDRRHDWTAAEAAYQAALQAGGNVAIVLNNRGFSRLAQRRLPEARQDFVSALEANPGFTAARTNLRLSLALAGDYASAVSGGSGDKAAPDLNNAGFVAALNGDLPTAQRLLGQAQTTSTSFYSRASANLGIATHLKGDGGTDAVR
jgi:Flp pilus assembly protein TadD